MKINRLQRFILNHAIWIDWLLPTFMTFSGAFFNYDVDKLNLDEKSHYRYVIEFVVANLVWVLILSIALYIFAKITEATAKPQLRKLEHELKNYQVQENIFSDQIRNLFDGYLYNFADLLQFGKSSENNERISLYIHDDNNTFIPCGRYSANPKYKQPSRTSYPDNEGCIAKGWENGWHFDNQFPCPEEERSKYIDYCLKEYDIKRNVCRKIKMKSRAFAVLSIRNNGDLFGVIVVESTDSENFTENDIKPILQKQNDFLAETIRRLKDFIPKPSNAANRGL